MSGDGTRRGGMRRRTRRNALSTSRLFLDRRRLPRPGRLRDLELRPVPVALPGRVGAAPLGAAPAAGAASGGWTSTIFPPSVHLADVRVGNDPRAAGGPAARGRGADDRRRRLGDRRRAAFRAGARAPPEDRARAVSGRELEPAARPVAARLERRAVGEDRRARRAAGHLRVRGAQVGTRRSPRELRGGARPRCRGNSYRGSLACRERTLRASGRRAARLRRRPRLPLGSARRACRSTRCASSATSASCARPARSRT